MRVLYLVHQYLPKHVGGTELYTQSVARALADAGHRTGIFYRHHARGEGLEHRQDEGVALWAAWSGPESPARRFLATLGDASIERSFRHVLDDFRPDLVHIQHLMGLPVHVVRALRQRAIPYVITLHDYWWVCANAQLITNDTRQRCSGPDRWLNCARCALARGGASPSLARIAAPALIPLMSVRGKLLREVLADAAGLIAPAPFVRDWYRSHGCWTDRIRLLPHGIEQPPRSAEPRGDRPVRFTYVGGLTWQKGAQVIVEAVGRLRGPVELWIAGDESADPAYVAGLRASGGGNVRFLGALSRAEVWAALAQTDVLVVPSLWCETFSLVTREAFAAGVPVIASRLGALADAVRDGVDGLLAAAGDVDAWRAAMQRIVDDPALLARLRAGVRPPMARGEHLERLEALYREILAGVFPGAATPPLGGS